jgi:hypothetical protein
LRPGRTGCTTKRQPVPLHAGHFFSVEFVGGCFASGFFIATFQKKTVSRSRPTAFRLGPGNVRCFQPSRSLRPRNKSRSLILIPALRVKSGTGKQTTAPSKSFLASSDDGVLERHALGIVFSKPFLGGLLVGNDLQMVDCRRHPCWCRRKSKLFSPNDPVGFRAFPARFGRFWRNVPCAVRASMGPCLNSLAAAIQESRRNAGSSITVTRSPLRRHATGAFRLRPEFRCGLDGNP